MVGGGDAVIGRCRKWVTVMEDCMKDTMAMFLEDGGVSRGFFRYAVMPKNPITSKISCKWEVSFVTLRKNKQL